MDNVNCTFYFEDLNTSRKKLFEEALLGVRRGRVLYILNEELHELPPLSQEFDTINKHYMKLITFLYAKSLDSLIESISTLPDWQSIPATIILDDLSTFCNKSNLQNACGVISLLLDTAYACSVLLETACAIHVSVSKKIVGEHYCNVIKELYFK